MTSDSGSLGDEVTQSGVFETVRDGYDAVYDALPSSEVFSRIWRDTAYGDEFGDEFAHIGFLTLAEGERLLELLGLDGGTLVDVACGTGGPGLWFAKQTGATLIGVDPSASGVAAAARRAKRVGTVPARFVEGTFEQTGLPDGSADAMTTIEAFQYAPDKRAAFREFSRVLRPGARAGLVCFEVDPSKAAGLPVLGVDPIPDYRPLIDSAGLSVVAYEETPGWEERVYSTFSALVEAADAIIADIGERAAAGALAEAMLTVQMKPYPRRVLMVVERS
ncbi:MAG TPA: class I SAM-dependent methyltransferase [Acidimicrobiales bacterium]|nr:class I SAM-dependent methyltransferase [Acidimicrobiales bacterium]